MRMTFNYTLLKLSSASYKRILDNYLIEKLKEGGQEWLTTCLSIIPVWSGASHGTFIKIATLINSAVSISIASSIPGLTGPNFGKTRSYAKLKIENGRYILEYGTSLWHLIYNEYNNANLNPEEGRLFARLRTPGPYNFQVTAARIFGSFAKTVRLPSPWKYLKLLRYKV